MSTFEGESKPEDFKILINQPLIDKFNSIAYDLKIYINTNISIYQSMDEETKQSVQIMSKEDTAELLNIRRDLRRLTNRLKYGKYSFMESNNHLDDIIKPEKDVE